MGTRCLNPSHHEPAPGWGAEPVTPQITTPDASRIVRARSYMRLAGDVRRQAPDAGVVQAHS
jgi:hypothetical protein